MTNVKELATSNYISFQQISYGWLNIRMREINNLGKKNRKSCFYWMLFPLSVFQKKGLKEIWKECLYALQIIRDDSKYGIPEQEIFIPTDCSYSSPKQRSGVEVQTRKSIHYTQFLNLCCFLVVDKVMKNDSTSRADNLEVLREEEGVLSTEIK